MQGCFDEGIGVSRGSVMKLLSFPQQFVLIYVRLRDTGEFYFAKQRPALMADAAGGAQPNPIPAEQTQFLHRRLDTSGGDWF